MTVCEPTTENKAPMPERLMIQDFEPIVISGPFSPTNGRRKPALEELHDLNRKRQEQWAKEIRGIAKAKTREVAVLLLSWENNDEKHSLYAAEELKDLTDVFENKYNFSVQERLLHTKGEAPRYQFTSILLDFLKRNDKPGTLLIIYYGGHGLRSEDGEILRLLGRNPNQSDPWSTELNWNDVEPLLYRLQADLLLVFDCCFAGSIERDRREWPASKSHFEFIGSTAFNQYALGPRHEGSFTRALINVLNDLAVSEKIFTTTTLLRKIERSEVFRNTLQKPVHSSCGKQNIQRNLKIMPLEKVSEEESVTTRPASETDRFYLHLKYVFELEPSDSDFKALINSVYDLVQYDRVPLKDVLWEGISIYNPRMSMSDAAYMLLACLRRRSSPTSPPISVQLELPTNGERSFNLPTRTLTNMTRHDHLLVPSTTDV